jgi:hypothetical protein
MVLFPICGVFVAATVNMMDLRSYARYIQFMRLEFDTKLGMHSPK